MIINSFEQNAASIIKIKAYENFKTLILKKKFIFFLFWKKKISKSSFFSYFEKRAMTFLNNPLKKW